MYFARRNALQQLTFATLSSVFIIQFVVVGYEQILHSFSLDIVPNKFAVSDTEFGNFLAFQEVSYSHEASFDLSVSVIFVRFEIWWQDLAISYLITKSCFSSDDDVRFDKDKIPPQIADIRVRGLGGCYCHMTNVSEFHCCCLIKREQDFLSTCEYFSMNDILI